MRNQILGALPYNQLAANNPYRPDPSRNQASSDQISPREREWFSNALSIDEAYGEFRGALATMRIGRMDNHWGLGMFYNGGDCADCDWGDSIDRAMVSVQAFDIYGDFALDFPGEGVTSNFPSSPGAPLYDRGQIDDMDQYTVRFAYEARSQNELRMRQQRLIEERAPVFEGGGLFSYRTQEGINPARLSNVDTTGPSTDQLIYRGFDMYIADAWARIVWQPQPDTLVRVELEGMGIFGSVENATYQAVGLGTGEGSANINCFDEATRNANSDTCLENSKDFAQFGLAVESEFSLGGPVHFGLNGGFASGGTTPNWGYGQQAWSSGEDLDFFRFDPDYRVDLILFRQVVGTITNATYLNPYVQAHFLEKGDYHLRFDFDTILSRAHLQEGTPSLQSQWLGVELDSAVRFFYEDYFQAALEGGLLFPLGALDAGEGNERLTSPGAGLGDFTSDQSASTAWTIQLKTFWTF